MFDAAARGDAIAAEPTSRIELPAGRYSVRVCALWRGPVSDAQGKPHDTMLQVLELRRREAAEG